MKKLFLVLFALGLLTNFNANAQLHVLKNPPLTFGGNGYGSTVSIMQVIDYPILLTGEDVDVVSYDFKIESDKAELTKIIKVEGAKLNQDAIQLVRNFNGKSGQITIQNVLIQKGEAKVETPYYLELKFNQ